jgi:hypothetical protein
MQSTTRAFLFVEPLKIGCLMLFVELNKIEFHVNEESSFFWQILSERHNKVLPS